MRYIWYESILKSLRHHIEAKHMNQPDALQELSLTEEYLHYESFQDCEEVRIVCPWSIHCECEWQVAGEITFKFKPMELKQ